MSKDQLMEHGGIYVFLDLVGDDKQPYAYVGQAGKFSQRTHLED